MTEFGAIMAKKMTNVYQVWFANR